MSRRGRRVTNLTAAFCDVTNASTPLSNVSICSTEADDNSLYLDYVKYAVCAFGLIGNSLIVAVLLKEKKKKSYQF